MKIININNKTNDSADSLRKKYIILFVFLFIIVVNLYIFNPFGILTKYAGPTIFISLFLGMFLITMIVCYDYLVKHPISIPGYGLPSNFSTNIFFILFTFVVSAGLIVLLMWGLGFFSSNIDTSGSGIFHFIINFLLLFVVLSIIYKILSLSPIGKSPLFQFIMNVIFYLPCLFVDLIELIINEYHKTTKSLVILLFIMIVLFIIYFSLPSLSSSYYLQGGKQFINQPISLNNVTSIATYQTLNDSDKFSYQYAFSFWFKIDAVKTNSSYNNYTSIFSYGDNPSIKYNASTNTLQITVRSNGENIVSIVDLTHQLEARIPTVKNKDGITDLQRQIKQVINKVNTIPFHKETDGTGQRIIYTKQDILLQKWNNLIINYNGGTLDVFLNGKLVKSAIEVVSYISYDTLTVGQKNGIIGNIANLIYYKEPLDIFKIQNLYNEMKDKNPPTINSNNNTILQ